MEVAKKVDQFAFLLWATLTLNACVGSRETTQWEYLAVEPRGNLSIDVLHDAIKDKQDILIDAYYSDWLNEYGKKGWRLTTVENGIFIFVRQAIRP